MPASTFSPLQRWLLVLAGLAGFAYVYVVTYTPWNLTNAFFIGTPMGRDFVNFWMAGHLALTGELDILVDDKSYGPLINRMLDFANGNQFIFSYPPHSLPLLMPFALVPFAWAAWLWAALNVFCAYGCVRLMKRDRALGILACLSPAVLIMAAFGHFGGFLGLLAVYILTRGHDRPVLAGALLSVTTIKPQFAAFLGLFLLLAGYRRAILFAVPFTGALIGVSLVAFGVKPWINFFQVTLPVHARIVSELDFPALRTAISPYIGAGMAGLPAWAAQAVQVVFGAVAIGGAVSLLTKRGATPRTMTLGLLAVILTIPYSAAYDLAIVAAPLTLALFAEEPGGDRLFLPFVPALLLWVMPPFAWHFGLALWPVASAIFAAVFLLALAREHAAARRQDRAQAGRAAVALETALPAAPGHA
jgi:hypothetical protein